ncbi:serine/threonine protein kinase [Stanieria sp. NIES-3757]|nr:serine/threonine protein kinase [Stanieria sp. NIES-3757]
MFTKQKILQTKYQLQQQLGHTSAGHQTWLAKDLNTNEKVTIKLLAFSSQMHSKELKLFQREAQILQSLKHPRIPKYRDYFTLNRQLDNGVIWFALVQDYIPGFSLQELLEQHQVFDEEKIRAIAQEILKILIYLHQLNPPVLHRDLKPSNLILGEDKQIYLIDFGAVQVQTTATGATFTIVGTAGYAPLEQFWGRAVAASDLYALGVTLIHLLTGISPANLPYQDSRIQFRDLVNLKPDLINWLEIITELSVEKRFPSATIALEALSSVQKVDTSRSRESPNQKSVKLKPEKSLIELEQEQRRLNIKIPAGGLARFNEILNAGCGGLIVYFLLFALSLLISIFLPYIGSFLISLALIYIVILCGTKTEINFEFNNFQIQRKFLIKKYSKQSCPNSIIVDIFIQRTGSIFQVNIRTTNHTYNLGGALSQDEAIWLVQEIKQWLVDS